MKIRYIFCLLASLQGVSFASININKAQCNEYKKVIQKDLNKKKLILSTYFKEQYAHIKDNTKKVQTTIGESIPFKNFNNLQPNIDLDTILMSILRLQAFEEDKLYQYWTKKEGGGENLLIALNRLIKLQINFEQMRKHFKLSITNKSKAPCLQFQNDTYYTGDLSKTLGEYNDRDMHSLYQHATYLFILYDIFEEGRLHNVLQKMKKSLNNTQQWLNETLEIYQTQKDINKPIPQEDIASILQEEYMGPYANWLTYMENFLKNKKTKVIPFEIFHLLLAKIENPTQLDQPKIHHIVNVTKIYIWNEILGQKDNDTLDKLSRYLIQFSSHQQRLLGTKKEEEEAIEIIIAYITLNKLNKNDLHENTIQQNINHLSDLIKNDAKKKAILAFLKKRFTLEKGDTPKVTQRNNHKQSYLSQLLLLKPAASDQKLWSLLCTDDTQDQVEALVNIGREANKKLGEAFDEYKKKDKETEPLENDEQENQKPDKDLNSFWFNVPIILGMIFAGIFMIRQKPDKSKDNEEKSKEKNDNKAPEENNDNNQPKENSQNKGPEENNDNNQPKENSQNKGPEENNDNNQPKENSQNKGPEENNDNKDLQENEDYEDFDENDDYDDYEDFDENDDYDDYEDFEENEDYDDYE
ncbi:MAG: hypothetical protein AAF335_03150 [Bacteroidota bacterium]